MILLQVGCVEHANHEVTFEGCFEGLNDEQTAVLLHGEAYQRKSWSPTMVGRTSQSFN